MIFRRIFVWNALKNFNNFTTFVCKSKEAIKSYDITRLWVHRTLILKKQLTAVGTTSQSIWILKTLNQQLVLCVKRYSAMQRDCKYIWYENIRCEMIKILVTSTNATNVIKFIRREPIWFYMSELIQVYSNAFSNDHSNRIGSKGSFIVFLIAQ